MLRRFHLFFGIMVVVIFILTGQYMHHKYEHLKDMELMNRVLFRTGHLYILLFGLLNVGLGSYFKFSKNSLIRKLQFLGSVAIVVASCLVIFSFFTELPTHTIERPIARFSLYLVFFGISTHGLLALFFEKEMKS